MRSVSDLHCMVTSPPTTDWTLHVTVAGSSWPSFGTVISKESPVLRPPAGSTVPFSVNSFALPPSISTSFKLIWLFGSSSSTSWRLLACSEEFPLKLTSLKSTGVDTPLESFTVIGTSVFKVILAFEASRFLVTALQS